MIEVLIAAGSKSSFRFPLEYVGLTQYRLTIYFRWAIIGFALLKWGERVAYLLSRVEGDLKNDNQPVQAIPAVIIRDLSPPTVAPANLAPANNADAQKAPRRRNARSKVRQ